MPSYVAEVPVRWSDQDLLAHVNHATVVTLIEDARHRWLASVGGAVPLRRPRVIVHVTVDYRTPVEYGPALLVEVSVARVGTTSWTLDYVGRQEGVTCFEAQTVTVALQPDVRTPRPLEPDETAFLRGYLV